MNMGWRMDQNGLGRCKGKEKVKKGKEWRREKI